MKDLGYMNGWGTEIPNELKEALAKGYEITEKKVIPESGLRELPLVGDKMLRGLAPFLEKYNIIIDSSK